MSDPVIMPHSQWIERGAALFGRDFRRWRFRCPSCGNIQSVESVTAATPRLAATALAWITHDCEGNHVAGRGCTSSLYGCLIPFHTLEVEKEGKRYRVFEFDEGSASAQAKGL